MPMSEYRKKKLAYVFNVFFDTNHSGNIDKKDFELAIGQVCKMRGWSGNSPQADAMKNRMLAVWEGLQKSADDDDDGEVSLDEWCAMWEEFGVSMKASEWQNDYMNLMFDIIDTSGDGCIDEKEFRHIMEGYGVDGGQAKAAFDKISKDGGVKITRDVFGQYWREYFSTDDEGSLGNFIFGKASFD